MRNEQTLHHGYYSADADRIYGTTGCIWEDSLGNEVKITATGDNINPKSSRYGWEDAVYVGMVARRMPLTRFI